MRRLFALSTTLALALAAPLQAASPATPSYPETRAAPVVEEIFGEPVSDPYRWLEGDVRQDGEIAAWVERQNAVTQSYLRQLDNREWFSRKVGELQDYERFGIPRKAGGKYFYVRNSGLQNYGQLFVQRGLGRKRQLLLDPNRWSGNAKDGSALALASWEPSPDGSLLAYATQQAGSDWRTIHLLDTRSGRTLPGTVRWAKFSEIAWVGNEGFFYSRFPEPEAGAGFSAPNEDHAVYFHRIGTDQAEDELVYATPGNPRLRHMAETTGDGRWAIISSVEGTDERNAVHLIDLKRVKREGWVPRKLAGDFVHEWRFVAGVRGKLYFRTNFGAPNGRIVTFDPRRSERGWSTLIAEADLPMSGASIVGDRLVIEYIRGGGTLARMHDLRGKAIHDFSLTGHGSARGFAGAPGDPETFYRFASFNRPEAVYRLDLESGQTTPFAVPELTFAPTDYVVERRSFISKDGTRVPLYIVRSRELAASGRAAPTLLYGYGGFDVSAAPGFSAKRMAWLEAGGVFALANIRGGGEFGQAWHDAGRRANKQNTFDDFIAAGEFLLSEGYTSKGGLAIEGRSNGGLLVAAVVNQRPDLFAAAHAAVGVHDMLRFDRWTAGRYWIDDYGDPSVEADFRVLRAYSPYHNVAKSGDYPAILVTTADSDDRVVPAHSFKYVAALQAADLGNEPHLLRVESEAGHGSGTPTDKRIAEASDVLSFLAYHTGLTVKSPDIQESH